VAEYGAYFEDNMEKEERLQTFIEALGVGNTPFLNAMEEEAVSSGVPIIRPAMQSLLKFFLALIRPGRILEIGTGTGFSASLMATYAPDAQIVTVEKDRERAEKAIGIFRNAGFEDRIRLRNDDAEDAMRSLVKDGERFDLLFMDAAKGQYIHLLPLAEELVRPGGLMISDNILQEGGILASKFAVARRDRTIHRRMREYLEALTHSAAWKTVLLGDGDGAAVSLRTV